MTLTCKQVTRAAIEDLKKALPGCRVVLHPAADQEDGGKENE
jgi:hypothetical protein